MSDLVARGKQYAKYGEAGPAVRSLIGDLAAALEAAQKDAELRREFICRRCGIRQDGEPQDAGF